MNYNNTLNIYWQNSPNIDLTFLIQGQDLSKYSRFNIVEKDSVPNNVNIEFADKLGELGNLRQEAPVDTADIMPVFNGDVNCWLRLNLRYPNVAAENGEEGKVVVRFVVERDGSISQPTIVKSVSPSLDKEVLRVVSKMPKWTPAIIGGKPVACWVQLPVTFSL